jgi:hypothetical protein
MRTGYQTALEMGATLAVKIDGDNQMPVESLPSIIAPILEGRADYTKGNRFYHSGAISQMPLIRRTGNVVLSFIAKASSGYWTIFDPTNGYAAIDATVLREIDLEHLEPGYFFENSMLIELSILRATVVDVPIPARYSGEISSLRIRRVFFEFPGLFLRGFLRRILMQYFVLDFSAASVFMICGCLMLLFGLVFGAFEWYKSLARGVAASTGTVMIAVLPIILGFQLLLQVVVLDIQQVPRRPRSRRPLACTAECGPIQPPTAGRV